MLAVLFLNRMAMKRLAARRVPAIKMVKSEATPDAESKVEYCRTCLSTDDLMGIFYGKESEEKRSHDLKLVTGLEIKMNDGLSQKMCTQCIEIMNTALQFRRTCKRAEKTLKSLVNGTKVKKKEARLKSIKTSSPSKSEVQQTELEVDHSYSYEPGYDADFQQDEYYDYNLAEDPGNQEIKPLLEKPAEPVKKKRKVLPNLSSYKCGTCNKEFRMKATFKAHTRFHTNYCVCETCGKRCRNNNQLQEHKRARHGLGRIHKCTYCEYSSATKEALIIHERRHTGERPYICDHCGATFHRRSNLVQHMPIHLPEKNFQCDMCPKRLASRKFLQIHKHNAHTGRRYGYLCPLCRHRFEKPNKCPMCPKRAKSKKLLGIHHYKYHRENRYRYVCPICHDTFSRPGNVRQHLVRAHEIPRDHQGVIERVQMSYPKEEKAEPDSTQTSVNMLPVYEAPVIDSAVQKTTTYILSFHN